jgi:hypothetical protein
MPNNCHWLSMLANTWLIAKRSPCGAYMPVYCNQW